MMRTDAESAVLGACLIDPQAYWRVADLLGEDDFATSAHRSMWNTIAELRKAGDEADFITVGERHPNLANLAVELSGVPCSIANIRSYAEWVLSAAVERRVKAAGSRIAGLGGKDCLPEAQRILASCQPRAMSAVRPIRAFVQESIGLMQQRCDSTEPITGVPTSLEWLDEMTSGWQRGDLIIIAARPSLGKTALALQALLHAADLKHPGFFASLEQSGAQIAERAMAHLSGVSIQSIMQPKRVEEEEWPRITNAASALGEMPLMIDETGALTVEAISARARQVNAERRLGLIAIDYLTQITPPRADTNANALQMVTRTLKAMAKDLAVPIILLSQLNRDGDEKPQLKHLRDSGAIEQDADLVLFLHRPDPSKRDLVELTLAKQRNGPTGSTYLHAAMDKMRFLPTEETPTVQPIRRTRGFTTHSERSVA